MKFLRQLLLALPLVLCCLPAAQAQTYPTRPIRMIVPFAPGGVMDATARMLAEGMATRLQQPVIVDNRPGAGGMTGTDVALKSAADGYTIALSSGGPLSLNVLLKAHSPYDPVKDIAPIGLVLMNDVLVVAAPALPASDFRQFVDLAKARPGKLSAGTPGPGTPAHLGSEMLRAALSLDVATVPYRGDMPAVADVIGGNLSVHFASPASVTEQIKGGRLKAIASLGRQRNPKFPNVPTAVEQGYGQFVVASWAALVAPAGTPSAVIQALNDAALATMRQTSFQERILAQGATPASSTPAELGAFIREEMSRWAGVLETIGIKPQ